MPYNDPPWIPMDQPREIKLHSKFAEELGELSAVNGRCMAQGLDGVNSDNDKVNQRWLEEELADVMACMGLIIQFQELDMDFIDQRSREKTEKILKWVGEI